MFNRLLNNFRKAKKKKFKIILYLRARINLWLLFPRSRWRWRWVPDIGLAVGVHDGRGLALVVGVYMFG